MPKLPQTDVVFGALALGFVIYITVKGDLKKWLSLMGL